MADIRLKKITIEQEPLIIQNGNVNVTDTTISDSALDGAFVTNGGVGISSYYDSTSCTSGGSLTVGGGASVVKTLQVGKDVILDSTNGLFRVKGISNDRLFLDNISNQYFYIAPDGVNKRFELYDSYIKINMTTTSINSTTGSLCVGGGLSVSGTEESISETNGGCLTVAGGAGIQKTLHVGKGITSIYNNTIGNIFTTGGNVGIATTSPSVLLSLGPSTVSQKLSLLDGPNGTNNFYGFGVINNLMHFHSGTTSGALGQMVLSSNGYLGMNTTSPSYTVDVNGSVRAIGIGSFVNNSNTVGNLFTTGGNVGINVVSPSYRVDIGGTFRVNGGTVNNSIVLNGITTIQNGIRMLNDSVNTINYIESGSNTDTTGSQADLRFGSVSSGTVYMTIATTGNIGIANTQPTYVLDVNGTTRVVSFTNMMYNSNTLGSLFTTGGNVGIGTSNPFGKLHVYDSASCNINIESSTSRTQIKSANDGNTYIQSQGDVLFTGIESTVLRNLCLTTSGNIGIANTKPSYRLDITGDTRITNGSLLATQNCNTIGSLFTTGGNVGINQVMPSYTVDITGNLHTTDIVVISSSVNSLNSTTGGLVLNSGGISINNTMNSQSITQGGSLTIGGGTAITKDMYVGGVVHFKNGTPSTSYSLGAVNIDGGLTISQAQNASNIGNGGALTVAGGASIGQDLYVGGQINGSGSSSSTFAYLTLTATDEAINLTTGTLVTFGGITIQCTTNATSVTNGGSILVNGGGSFASDVYIGGHLFNYETTNYYSNTNEIIDLYDTLNVKRFSLNFDLTSKAFAIVRYDALGNFVEKSFEIDMNGYVSMYNTSPSTANNTGALILRGGLSIGCTQAAYDVNNGGSVTIGGGIAIAKNMLINGDVHLYSTTQSNDVSSGSLILAGGAAISGNLNVLGNTILNGNLTVLGATTSVDSNNTVLSDNIFVLNSGPAGSKDSGFIVQRYQQDNDTGSGDVVNDTRFISFVLPLQGSVSGTQIKLPPEASSTDDYYKGWWIKIASGFSNNQVRQIVSYNGTSRTASVTSAWTTQNPNTGDYTYLYNKPYVGVIYSELNDRFEFGSTVQDPGQTNVTFTDRIPIYSFSLTCNSTSPSNSPTSGSILSYGGISINNTTDALSMTNGGTITTLGGASIGKNLYVGSNLTVNGVSLTPNSGDVFSTQSFSAQNNTSGSMNGVIFDSTIWGFDMFLSARLIATNNLYANFNIRGINKSGSWELTTTYVGDDTGIQFSLSNTGHLNYTTQDYGGFVSLTFKYRCLVN